MVKTNSALGAFLMGLAATSAPAASTEPGLQVAIEKCSGCHAIREEGLSPHPNAPPLRTLNTRYPIDALGENLVRGMEVGHRDMPILILTPEEVADLLIYLRSLDPCGKPPSDKAAMVRCFAPMGTGN